MLLEIALADAYGAGFEFKSPEIVERRNTLTGYLPHGLDAAILGRYTDDTQMSIALAECIIDGNIFDRDAVAEAFVRVFHRDPRAGYAGGFFQLLQECESGRDLLAWIEPNSTRNGAAMRSVPLGVLESPEQVLQAAALQADITHGTDIARVSSQTVGLVAFLGLRLKGVPEDIPDFLATFDLNRWDYTWQQPVSVEAFDTVSAALGLLMRHRSMAQLLRACVGLTGDTDSVAAIAVGLASCFGAYEADLPAWLAGDLDEPDFGVDFLVDLNRRLLAQLR